MQSSHPGDEFGRSTQSLLLRNRSVCHLAHPPAPCISSRAACCLPARKHHAIMFIVHHMLSFVLLAAGQDDFSNEDELVIRSSLHNAAQHDALSCMYSVAREPCLSAAVELHVVRRRSARMPKVAAVTCAILISAPRQMYTAVLAVAKARQQVCIASLLVCNPAAPQHPHCQAITYT